MAASLRVKSDLPLLLPLFTQLRQLGAKPQPLLKQIAFLGENSTRERFKTETDPDGNKWKPSRRVKKIGGRTLTKDGHLANSISSDADDHHARWGSNRIYAAIHQLGGTLDIPARSQHVYFKQNQRSGEVGHRFVKKSKSNFAQRVTIGAYQIVMPARPFLGISKQDSNDILELVSDYVRSLIRSATPGGA